MKLSAGLILCSLALCGARGAGFFGTPRSTDCDWQTPRGDDRRQPQPRAGSARIQRRSFAFCEVASARGGRQDGGEHAPGWHLARRGGTRAGGNHPHLFRWRRKTSRIAGRRSRAIGRADETRLRVYLPPLRARGSEGERPAGVHGLAGRLLRGRLVDRSARAGELPGTAGPSDPQRREALKPSLQLAA